MRITHFAPLDNNFASGLNYSIPSLIRALRGQGVDASLVVTGASDVSDAFIGCGCRWYREKDLDIHSLIDESDLIVFHSTYILPQIRFASYARRHGVPYVLTPRGGLTRGAAQSSCLKKTIADRLFFRRFVRNAVALHCLTENEAEESRHWHSRIFVVGNGIELQAPPKPGKQYEQDSSLLEIVFVGRLSIYHKGLDVLLEGIAAHKSKVGSPRFRIRLYGPGEDGSRQKLLNLIARMGIEEIVSIHPPVYGAEKADLLHSADVFVLTSRFEGHPMGVLEALAAGVPCMLSDGTNLAGEIEEAGAGWRIQELSSSGVQKGLAAIERTGREQLLQMSCDAKQFALRFSWSEIASRTIERYSELSLQQTSLVV